MAEAIGTDAWLEQLAAKQNAHHRNTAELKQQILKDEDLPDLDRAVLGATGSPVELERYQAMAARVADSIGEPILRFGGHFGDPDGVENIEGGIIIGPVQASVHYSEPCLKDEPRRFTSASLEVPVSPAMEWDDYGEQGSKVQVSFDEELAGSSLYPYDTESGVGLLSIAELRPPEPGPSGYGVKNPYEQFNSRIAPSSVLIGRLAIYEHPRFGEGIHRGLAALEERVAQDQPERRLVSHVVLG